MDVFMTSSANNCHINVIMVHDQWLMEDSQTNIYYSKFCCVQHETNLLEVDGYI